MLNPEYAVCIPAYKEGQNLPKLVDWLARLYPDVFLSVDVNNGDQEGFRQVSPLQNEYPNVIVSYSPEPGESASFIRITTRYRDNYEAFIHLDADVLPGNRATGRINRHLHESDSPDIVSALMIPLSPTSSVLNAINEANRRLLPIHRQKAHFVDGRLFGIKSASIPQIPDSVMLDHYLTHHPQLSCKVYPPAVAFYNPVNTVADLAQLHIRYGYLAAQFADLGKDLYPSSKFPGGSRAYSGLDEKDLYWVLDTSLVEWRLFEVDLVEFLRQLGSNAYHQDVSSGRQTSSSIWKILKSTKGDIFETRQLALVDRYDRIKGWLPPEEGIILSELVRGLTHLGSQDIIEIGSYMGKSTCYLADSLRYNFRTGTVYAVDPWENKISDTQEGIKTLPEDSFQEFHKNCYHFIQKGFIAPIRGTSKNMRQLGVPQKAGMVFVDGLHTDHYPEEDFRNTADLLVDGGFMVLHDYHPDWPAVQNLAEKIKKDIRFSIWFQAGDLFIAVKQTSAPVGIR